MANNPIFSTKELYSGKKYIVPLLLYAVGACCLFIQFPNILDSALGYVIGTAFLMVFIYPFTRSTQIKKSYIDLYEDHIEGFSVTQSYWTNDACSFSLTYDQILNVESQKDIVKIYFNGGNYLVQATECEAKVCEIINSFKGAKSENK